MNGLRLRLTIPALLLVASFGAFASKTETLQELIARAEAAKPADRPALYVEVAERQLESADKLYTAGNVDEARSDLQEVVSYSEKAHDAVIESDKKIKGVEISLRKMAARLRDIQRTVNFDDQAPVQAAATRIESLRTDLLTHMFKGKNK